MALTSFPSISTQTGSYTVLISDDVVDFNISANAVATLPSAVGITGKRITIKRVDANTAFTLNVATTSSQTIDGRASGSIFLSINDYVQVVSDGSNWKQIAGIETVAFMVGASTTSIAAANVETKIVHSTVVFDTHGAYNVSTGNFTTQISGLYEFTQQVVTQAATPTSIDKKLSVYFNRTGSVTQAENGYFGNPIGTTSANTSATSQTTYRMRLIVGDVVNCNAVQNLTAGSLLAVNNAGYTYFTGRKV